MPNQAQPSGLTCNEVTRQATEFLESRLADAVAAAVAQHLNACSSCCTYFKQMALVRDALRGLPGEMAPERLRKKLLDELARNSDA